jgi:hypothetical protein
MAINGGQFTQDFRTQLRKYSDGTTRIGEEGRLWYNNSDQTLRVSDGETEGGIVLNSGGGGGSSGVTVQEEGSSLSTKGTTLNFVGTGITATGTGATKTITVDASAITVQDEGSALSTAATVLNFVGSGVTASGTGATKTITISGGGGGDVADDTSPQLGGDLDIAGFNITSAVSNQNINIVPNGTGKLVLDGDFLPAANITYNLGSSSSRWKDLFLSGNTIDLAGSTISSDGTGTINISSNGVTLPRNSKTEDERALATLSANNSTNQVVVVTPFFSNAGGLVTKNSEFEFNATVDNQPVFTGTATFTLANGDSFAESSIVLFQL